MSRGSTTACIATLEQRAGVLHTANVGDSGWVLIRHGAIVARSVEQLHSFNMPYQLTIPAYKPTPGRKNFPGTTPDDADCASLPVHAGDIILLMTDGVLDNIRLERLAALVTDYDHRSAETLDHLASCIVREAVYRSMDPDCVTTPYSERAHKHGLDYVGGKPDDTTLVIAYVVGTPFHGG